MKSVFLNFLAKIIDINSGKFDLRVPRLAGKILHNDILTIEVNVIIVTVECWNEGNSKDSYLFQFIIT